MAASIMPRVFVIQKSFGKNLLPAAEFGRLITIFEPYNVSDDLDRSIEILKNTLEDFCDDDFLLAIGSPTAMMLAGIVAASANNGRFNLLEWDRQCFKYRVVKIVL